MITREMIFWQILPTNTIREISKENLSFNTGTYNIKGLIVETILIINTRISWYN